MSRRFSIFLQNCAWEGLCCIAKFTPDALMMMLSNETIENNYKKIEIVEKDTEIDWTALGTQLTQQRQTLNMK